MTGKIYRSTGGVLIALALFLAGCETDNLDRTITREAAEQMAVGQLKNGYIVGVAQEIDLGRQVYKIFVQNDSKARRVLIDVATGRLIEVKDATDEYLVALAKSESVLEPVSLSHRDAAEFVALKAVPGNVRKWRVLLDESGRIVFRFNVVTTNGQENRVTVDARSQEVLEVTMIANKS